MVFQAQARKWYQVQWFAPQDSPEERKLIRRLDLLIVPYVFLAYWVKYIDQANINNAYVSGLKEDLGFNGNQLVDLQTIYVVGAVVGQIPFMFLFTRVPMHWLLPSLDIAWGICTLLQYRVQSYGELMAYRFLVGWFEAAFFPAVHYIFGSWYRGDEIARRGGFFYVGLTLGTLTAALIQSATSATLDGLHGLAGWRWMYIICAIITIPVGILGYLILPGTIEKPNRTVMSGENVAIAKARLKKAGHSTGGHFSVSSVKDAAGNWQIWAFLALDIFFWNGGAASNGQYLLWLKSLDRYSASRLNQLGAIAPALGIFYTLFICFSSDLLWGPAWAITVAYIWNIIGLIILTVWNVPESALWFAFATTYSCVSMSSVLYGWVNTQLRYSPSQRAFTLVLINTVAQSTTAWTPLLVFKTVEGPRFIKGYPFSLANAICLIITAHIIAFWIQRRQRRAGNVGTPEADFVEPSRSDSDSEGQPEPTRLRVVNEGNKGDA